MNSAVANDVIIVAPGTYKENIYIGISGLVIKSSSGSPKDTKIVANDSSKYVIQIQNVNRVTIKGFNVSGGNHGIGLEGSTGSTLEDNVVHSNKNFSIYLANANNNILINNTMFNNTNGINLVFSDGNNISENKVFNDTIGSNTHNIFLNNSHNNNLQSNIVSDGEYGIAMRYSNNNNLTSNNASGNKKGIYLTLKSSANKLLGNLANSNLESGIILDNAGSGNNLINNTARLNSNNGIGLANSSNNYLTNNVASQNNKGIYLQSSASGNLLSGNIVNLNFQGIQLENAGSNNNLTGNTVNFNTNYGIYLVNSRNNFLLDNIALSDNKGIYIMSSNGNKISNNTLLDTITEGITLSLSNSNTLSRNSVYNNSFGIFLNSSDSNEISSNTITSARNYSIAMCAASNGNHVFNNYFNSKYNTRVRNASNDWNTTKTAGTSIAGGPYLGGNFWGTPSGEGHSQTKADNDSDGITEEIFSTANVTDYLPLVAVEAPVFPEANFSTNISSGPFPLTVQFTDTSQNAISLSWDFGDGNNSTAKNPVHIFYAVGTYTVNLTATNANGTKSKTADITVLDEEILPVANFTVNKTSGYYPLTVLFNDLSQNAISLSWDFGDGANSTEQNPVHTYSAAGTYTVRLTATNANGTSPAKTATITVTEESSSSGGSSHHSSGGGGGGGGSPEPQTNVQVKELSRAQVTNGKPVMFEFPNNVTCVVYVGFDAKKTAGKITTIAEQLKNKSPLVSALDSGEVYKYFNLWVGNSGFASSNNIENPVVCFKVEKSWLQDKKINQNSITLNRYNDNKWSQIPVKLLKEDSKYLYFTAETPGFSFFAIAGKAVEKEKVAEAKPSTNTSKLEKNSTVSETEPEQKTEQEAEKDKTTSIPGFEALYVVACLFMVFLHRRK
ncbi:Cell surface protein [Methanosarcina barkeri str. Wiesmoor]|uniref:Cell surface protein n=1 Tax=Methanosarcina barkeri str. Wiesmoor TaxID=1434109 RepID=A0A0E3QM60_METBA|nr:NosD domain-containing protein [Methanosarcina barkeri]AKB51062.1 Cell surface protein [Methanosarcina barkeri str. Wiesmoor]